MMRNTSFTAARTLWHRGVRMGRRLWEDAMVLLASAKYTMPYQNIHGKWHVDLGHCQIFEIIACNECSAAPASDCMAGSDAPACIDVMSAVSGGLIMSCEVTADATLAHVVRRELSASCDLLYFGVGIFHAGNPIDDLASWEGCGRPKEVFAVKKHRTLDWTEDIFVAIETGDNEKALRCLQQGQDPNCLLLEHVLSHAAVKQNVVAVALLAQGGTSANFLVGPNLRAPIHVAAVQEVEILDILWQVQAGPNLRDRGGMGPLHHAMCIESLRQSQRADMLLRFGAESCKETGMGTLGFPLRHLVGASQFVWIIVGLACP